MVLKSFSLDRPCLYWYKKIVNKMSNNCFAIVTDMTLWREREDTDG